MGDGDGKKPLQIFCLFQVKVIMVDCILNSYISLVLKVKKYSEC
jgi:hypothetical protein